MQIVIPMSGFGERFRKAGYQVPKPLIEIEGKPVIEHVVDMFPGETQFTFICNEEHLSHPEYRMEEILRRICPTGRIFGIRPHKLGPINAVMQVADHLSDDEPTIVNYCDFTCYWDWSHFKSFVKSCEADGALPAYKGFHPHTLGTTNYAYMRESEGWTLDIQEKQPYTSDRMQEYASSGTYYFRTGRLMKEAFRATVEQNLNIGGEYYVSLAYKPLLRQGKKIAVYPLQHFMQWGTPEDVREYEGWSRIFRRLLKPDPTDATALGSVLVPMAGLGQRFANENYKVTKPLIPVSGRPMVIQATRDLPSAEARCFALREDMPGFQAIGDELRSVYPGAVLLTLKTVTEGQACTALLALQEMERHRDRVPEPVTVGACDNGALYDHAALERLFRDPSVDVIVWGARGHANAVRRPEMFGWIDAQEGAIRGISVKKPLGNPANDPIVIGMFTFRRAEDLRKVVQSLMARDGRVNGEFYLDSCINDALELGLRCVLFEVEGFISWGTPNDLRTFEYWQSCFHKWEGHPYRLEKDSWIPPEALPGLDERYAPLNPRPPQRGAI